VAVTCRPRFTITSVNGSEDDLFQLVKTKGRKGGVSVNGVISVKGVGFRYGAIKGHGAV